MNFLPACLLLGSILQISNAQINPLKITPTVPGEFRLDWVAEDQRGYQMEGSPDLVVWTDVDSHVLGTGAPKALLVASNADKYFWRLRRGAMRPGFNGLALARHDDDYSAVRPLGFTINFYGKTYSNCYVNNNGTISFTGAVPAWVAKPLIEMHAPLIAPFWADVDTRLPDDPNIEPSDVVRYSAGSETANGRPAFGATYKTSVITIKEPINSTASRWC